MKSLLYVLFAVMLSQQLTAQKKSDNPTYFISTGVFSSWSGKQMLYFDARLWKHYSLFGGLGVTFRPSQGSEVSKFIDQNDWGKRMLYHQDSPTWEGNHDVADNYASFANRSFGIGPALSIGVKYLLNDGNEFFSIEGRYLRQNIQAQKVSEIHDIGRVHLPEQRQREYVNSYDFLGSFGVHVPYTYSTEFFIGLGFRYYRSLRLDIGYNEGAYRNATRTISGTKGLLVLGVRHGFEFEAKQKQQTE